MMKQLLSAMVMVAPLFLDAQSLQGKIFYKQEVRIQFDESQFEQMTDERRKQLRERMKSWGKSKKTLVFTPKESLYRNYSPHMDAAEGEEWAQESGNSHWRRMRPVMRVYRAIPNQQVVEQQEVFDKKFLITEESERRKWKMTGKQERILEHACQQAVSAPNDSTTIIAWFSPQIPVASGPDSYGGLPGMILKVNLNDGERVITATEVRLGGVVQGEIVKPEKGKEVTRAEFTKIMDDKRKEMREMGGGGYHGH